MNKTAWHERYLIKTHLLSVEAIKRTPNTVAHNLSHLRCTLCNQLQSYRDNKIAPIKHQHHQWVVAVQGNKRIQVDDGDEHAPIGSTFSIRVLMNNSYSLLFIFFIAGIAFLSRCSQ